jgi:hypothetical protein
MAEGGAFEGGFKLYRYDPNLAANIVFVVLFAVLSIGHVFLLLRKRTWYFIPFVVGCVCKLPLTPLAAPAILGTKIPPNRDTVEAVGYIGRAIAATEAPDFTLIVYILQTLLILLGPALLAASIYMILARLIRQLGAEEYALIRTKWMTKVFVTGDVISFFAQGGGKPTPTSFLFSTTAGILTPPIPGGGLLAKAKTKDDQKLGESVILGGLAIQIVFFGFFIVTTVIFHLRMNKNPTARSYSVTGPWRQLVFALYISSVLVMVRSVFRMIEFGMGNDSVLMSHEAYLLGLDGALMFIVAAVLLWYHPSKVLDEYKEAVESVESGRNTAESLQMLSISAETNGGESERRTTPKRYDSDSTGVPGQQGYAYGAPPGANRYSTAYEW